jgi:ankyrin repeat protein
MKVVERLEEFLKESQLSSKASLSVMRLLTAAGRGDLVTIKQLIEQGADVSAKDYSNRTALHLAVVENQLSAAALLLLNGADLTVKDKNNDDPHDCALHAVQKGQTDFKPILQLLDGSQNDWEACLHKANNSNNPNNPSGDSGRPSFALRRTVSKNNLMDVSLPLNFQLFTAIKQGDLKDVLKWIDAGRH